MSEGKGKSAPPPGIAGRKGSAGNFDRSGPSVPLGGGLPIVGGGAAGVAASVGAAAVGVPSSPALLSAVSLGLPIPFALHFFMGFLDKSGEVDVPRVADRFRMTKGQLAETVGLSTATVAKAGRQRAPRTQARMTEMLEIISRVREWAGGETQAMAWYRSQPIPALDGRTPEALVKSGRAVAVREYLDHLALGGFA